MFLYRYVIVNPGTCAPTFDVKRNSMMLTKLEYPEDTAPNFGQILEQTEYLRGMLFADSAELHVDLDPNLIDRFGTGNRDFWRGFIEASGIVKMYPETPPYIPVQGPTYPRVQFKATYGMLTKFLAFLQEEIHTRQGIQWKWDADGQQESRARGGTFRVTGQKGQEVVRVLYLGCSVSKESFREEADQIVQWVPRR
ncbi:MAG: hypothetical protein ACLQU1_41540 [Bryobacteraceae bacterium]